MADEVIAMFELEEGDDGVGIAAKSTTSSCLPKRLPTPTGSVS